MTQIQKNIAVIGCGYWGKNLVRNFYEIGALAAVCDADTQQAANFAAQYGAKDLTLDQVFESADINGVVIAAPAAQHYTLAKRALNASKDVFVEKPLSLSAKEGEELCKIAKDKGKILMVGHLLHYHSAYLKLKELVKNGELGELRYIYSNRLNLGKVRREEDILWSFAPHDISMILDLMGEEPKTVDTHGGFYLGADIADVTTTHMTFSGKKKAHIFVSWLHPFKEQKLVVVGDKAMAVFEDGLPWDEKLKLYRHNVSITDESTVPVIHKADAENVKLEEVEPLKNECSHFLDCMASRKAPRTDGEEGLRVLKVLEQASKFVRQDDSKRSAA